MNYLAVVLVGEGGREGTLAPDYHIEGVSGPQTIAHLSLNISKGSLVVFSSIFVGIT